MNKKILEYIETLDVESIPRDRLPELNVLIDYVSEKNANSHSVRLNFICTHNSRRSHFSQIWAQCMAHHQGINLVQCYSGGTERTALFPAVIETLKSIGFQIDVLSPSDNPLYQIKYSENEPAVLGFSKKMNSIFNPKSEFAAIMTCSSADEACPIVAGAEIRIPIRYEDPKLFDGTEHQTEKYEERSREIATEMLYVFSQIKKQNA